MNIPLEDELNPNHPIANTMRDEWHKIVALLIHKFELGDITITDHDIDAMETDYPDGPAVAIKHGEDGLDIKLVTLAEGRRLAKANGGLVQ